MNQALQIAIKLLVFLIPDEGTIVENVIRLNEDEALLRFTDNWINLRVYNQGNMTFVTAGELQHIPFRDYVSMIFKDCYSSWKPYTSSTSNKISDEDFSWFLKLIEVSDDQEQEFRDLLTQMDPMKFRVLNSAVHFTRQEKTYSPAKWTK